MAAACACTEHTAVAVSVFGTNNGPVGQHAGTGPRAVRPKPASWAPKAATRLALQFALIAAPLGLRGVARTAVETSALEALTVVIANHALGARDDDRAWDGASAAFVLGIATVANGTSPVSGFKGCVAGACSVAVAFAVARARVEFPTVTLILACGTRPPTCAGALSSSGSTFAAYSMTEADVFDSSWTDLVADRSVETLVANLARFRLRVDDVLGQAFADTRGDADATTANAPVGDSNRAPVLAHETCPFFVACAETVSRWAIVANTVGAAWCADTSDARLVATLAKVSGAALRAHFRFGINVPVP